MIVEVTGPSGVGKSTFINKILKELSKNGFDTGTVSVSKRNYSKHIPNCISNLESHNIYTDVYIFPWFVLFFFRNISFSLFALKNIFKNQTSAFEKLALLRSFIRKSGIRHFLERKIFNNIIVLVDEGLVHSAHNFLCSPYFCADKKEAETFFELCPEPDLIVLLTATKDRLINQLRTRGDFSPRIKSDKEFYDFVYHSHNLFSIISLIIDDQKAGIHFDLDKESYEDIKDKFLRYLIKKS